MALRILQDLEESNWQLTEARLDHLFGKEAKGSLELLKNLLKFTKKTTLEKAGPFLDSAWEARKRGPKGRGEKIWTSEDIKRAMESHGRSDPVQEGMMTPPPTGTPRRGRPRKMHTETENEADINGTSGIRGSRKRRYNSESTISIVSNDEVNGSLGNDQENISLKGTKAGQPVKRMLFNNARRSTSIVAPNEPHANQGPLPTPDSPLHTLRGAAACNGNQVMSDDDKENGLCDDPQSSNRSVADALLHFYTSRRDEPIKDRPNTQETPRIDTNDEVSGEWVDQMIEATMSDTGPLQSSGFHEEIGSRINGLPDTENDIEPLASAKEPIHIHDNGAQPANSSNPEVSAENDNALSLNPLPEATLSSAEAFRDWQARIYPLIQEHISQYKRYEIFQADCMTEWNELAKGEESVSSALEGHKIRQEQAQKAINNAVEATKDDERRFKNDLPGDEEFFNLRAQQAAEYEQRWVERREEARKSVLSLEDEADVLRSRMTVVNTKMEQVRADMIPWAAVTRTTFWDIGRPRS